MRLALFAAFPQELKYLRKLFVAVEESAESLFPLFISKMRACEIVVVQTGMTRANIETAFCYVRDKYSPDVVLSIGFCGALYSGARVGDLVWASQCFHLDEGQTELSRERAFMTTNPPDTGRKKILAELHQMISIQEGSFVTLSEWVPKSRLMQADLQGIPFPVCDRETFYLAQWSQGSRLPFIAVRAVTDRADEDIPRELFQVTDETGHYSLLRALGILIAKPSLIFRSIKLGRNSARASRNLCQAVNALLEIFNAPDPCSRQRP